MVRSLEEDLYLLVHNIDGPMLRNEKAQAVLASLAAHPKVGFLQIFSVLPTLPSFAASATAEILQIIEFFWFKAI